MTIKSTITHKKQNSEKSTQQSNTGARVAERVQKTHIFFSHYRGPNTGTRVVQHGPCCNNQKTHFSYQYRGSNTGARVVQHGPCCNVSRRHITLTNTEEQHGCPCCATRPVLLSAYRIFLNLQQLRNSSPNAGKRPPKRAFQY